MVMALLAVLEVVVVIQQALVVREHQDKVLLAAMAQHLMRVAAAELVL